MKRTKITRTLELNLGLLSLPIVSNNTLIKDSGIIQEVSATELETPTEVTQDGINYLVYLDHAEVKGGTSSSPGNPSATGNITIAESVNGKPVTIVGNYAFYNCTSLTSIILPNSLTSIGNCAFWYCTSLISISIPNSVTSFNIATIRYCTSLTSIILPDSVTSIDNYVFPGCSNLKNIKAKKVVKLGIDAFYNCSSIESILVDKSLVQGTKPTALSGTWYRIYLYDKNDGILASYWVKSGTDFRDYANKVGTEWGKISGTGLMSNISSDMEFQLTGDLVDTTPEQKLEMPTLNISNQSPKNREDITTSIN